MSYVNGIISNLTPVSYGLLRGIGLSQVVARLGASAGHSGSAIVMPNVLADFFAP